MRSVIDEHRSEVMEIIHPRQTSCVTISRELFSRPGDRYVATSTLIGLCLSSAIKNIAIKEQVYALREILTHSTMTTSVMT